MSYENLVAECSRILQETETGEMLYWHRRMTEFLARMARQTEGGWEEVLQTLLAEDEVFWPMEEAIRMTTRIYPKTCNYLLIMYNTCEAERRIRKNTITCLRKYLTGRKEEEAVCHR